MLDWLGDLGGLFDALFIICGAIVAPVATFTMKATLLAKFFRFKPRDKNDTEFQESSVKKPTESFSDYLTKKSDTKQDRLAVFGTLLREFKIREKIKKLSFYTVNLLCMRGYKKKITKSHSKMMKELDLQKFIHRQRLLVTSLIGLLDGRQTMFVNKMSQMMLRESSDS